MHAPDEVTWLDGPAELGSAGEDLHRAVIGLVDSRPDPRDWASLGLADALAVTPPTPQSTVPSAIAEQLLPQQIEDVGLILDARARGEQQGFLLGNATGTGRTGARRRPRDRHDAARLLAAVSDSGRPG